PLIAIAPHLPEIAGLATGGMASAFCGARLVRLLSDDRLTRTMAVLLAGIGILLLIEAAFPFQKSGLLPDDSTLRLAIGALFGLGIGMVSSVLGVAGWERLSPALIS